MGLLELYVACMVFGGFFVMLSVVSGLGEADADLEAEADADFDAELDADADVEADADLDVEADADADLDGGFDPDADLDGVDAGGGVDLNEVPFEFDLEGAGIETAQSSGGSVDVETGPRKSFNPLVSFKFWTFGLAFFGLTGFVFEQFGIWGSSLGVMLASIAMGLFAGLSVSYGLRMVDQSEGASLSDRDYLGASAEVLLPIEQDRAGKVRMEVEGQTIDRRATAFEDETSFATGDTCFVLGFGEEGVRVVDVETVEQQVVARDERRTLEEFDEEVQEERSARQQVTKENA